MLIDCHVHLDSFTCAEVSAILKRASTAGVGFVISAGTDVHSSERSAKLSRSFKELFSGIGIHPMELEDQIDQPTYDKLRDLAVCTKKVVVVSEIGLDFIDGAPDRSIQYQAFREQIRLARDLQLPIVFHSRESHKQVLQVLKEERGYEVGGIMHYFQYDERTAKMAIDLGFYISLAKPLLRSPILQQVAKNLPIETIVVETDSAPQPFKKNREKWTEPRHLHDIVTKLASLKDVPVEEIEYHTTNNIRSLLKQKWTIIEQTLHA